MFDYIDGIMRALGKKKTQLKEDLCFAVMFAARSCPNIRLKLLLQQECSWF